MKTVRALTVLALLGLCGCFGPEASDAGGRGWVPPEVHFTIPLAGPDRYQLCEEPVAGEEALAGALRNAVAYHARRGTRVSVQFALMEPASEEQFARAKAAARSAGTLPWERLLGQHSGEGEMFTVTIIDISDGKVHYRVGDKVIYGGAPELFAELAAVARGQAAAGKRCSVRVLVNPEVHPTRADVDVVKAACGAAALEFRTLGYRLKSGGIVGPAVGGRPEAKDQKDSKD